MGYIKAQSVASLVFGTAFGVALLLSSLLLFSEKLQGLYASILLTASLMFFFIYRFLQTYRFMPAGLICILSFGVLTALTIHLINNRKKNIPSSS